MVRNDFDMSGRLAGRKTYADGILGGVFGTGLDLTYSNPMLDVRQSRPRICLYLGTLTSERESHEGVTDDLYS